MHNPLLVGAAMRPPVAACLRASKSCLVTGALDAAGHTGTACPRSASAICLPYPSSLARQEAPIAWEWKGTQPAFPIASPLALRYDSRRTYARLANLVGVRILVGRVARLVPSEAWRTGTTKGGSS